MRRNQPKLAAARRKAAAKTPSRDVLMKRAKKRARTTLMKKMIKDRDFASMTPSEKAQIEKKLDKKKSVIDRLAKKIVVQMKKED